jgi:hypothetical protein
MSELTKAIQYKWELKLKRTKKGKSETLSERNEITEVDDRSTQILMYLQFIMIDY